MPRFSGRSMDELHTLDDRLVAVLSEAIKHIDFTILEGARTLDRQRQLLAAGKTLTLNSKHVVSDTYPLARAVDIAPYPIDWGNKERFVYFAGWIMGIAHVRGTRLRWGGDWDRDTEVSDERFRDLGHFELL